MTRTAEAQGEPAPRHAIADDPPVDLRQGGIATLPPLSQATATGYPVSQRTSEPRRPAVAGIATALFYLSAAWTAASSVLALLVATDVSLFHRATRIWAWAQPDPVSWASVLLVLLVALVAVVVVAATGSAAFNAWNGHPWTRWIGLAAVGVSLGTLLLNPIAVWVILPAAVAAGLTWLPAMGRYLSAWREFRSGAAAPRPSARIVYGPRRRF